MRNQKSWWLFSLVMILAVGLSACAGSTAAPQPAANPTVVIVQYVTQVVATVTPAPPVTPQPPKPAAAQAQPVLINNTYNPYMAPIYYPLKGCPIASRLHVGDMAFVANNNSVTGLRMSADDMSPLARRLEAGEVLNVLDGPYCTQDALVWKVSDIDGEKGFVAEGDGSIYWLLPYGQAVAADDMEPTPYMKLPVAFKQGYGCRPR